MFAEKKNLCFFRNLQHKLSFLPFSKSVFPKTISFIIFPHHTRPSPHPPPLSTPPTSPTVFLSLYESFLIWMVAKIPSSIYIYVQFLVCGPFLLHCSKQVHRYHHTIPTTQQQLFHDSNDYKTLFTLYQHKYMLIYAKKTLSFTTELYYKS